MAVNPLAIGGGVVATAAVVGGGLYAGGVFSGSEKPSTSQQQTGNKPDSMPEWKDLSTEASADTTYGDGKYAKDYKKYFVSAEATATGGNTKQGEKDWWKWSLKNRYKKISGDLSGFKNKETADALKAACKAAYQATTENVKTGEVAVTAETQYKETDIWKYCSPLGQKPTTVKDADGYGSGTIGNTQKNNLISVKDGKNDEFWKVRQKNFFSETNFSAEHKFFKALHDLKTTTTNELALKEKCKEAYDKTPASSAPTTADQTTAEEVKKYCYL